MEALEEKYLKISRGLTYRYYISSTKSTDSNKPPLMLHHGFPETAHLWVPLLPMLTALPNRLIIPDLLGFGGTSNPTDPQSYAYDLMTRDLLDILDAEGVEKVISVGHDHGSGSAARFYNHAPDRTAALILLNVPYQVPNKNNPFDLAGINALTTSLFGYPIFEYWNFLTAADAPAILEENIDRIWECAHAATFDQKKQIYCVKDGMRSYLTDHSLPRIETKPYAYDENLKQRWMSQLREGGFAGPVCWYTAMTQGVQFESDKMIPNANLKVNVPTLFVGCELDTVCRMELIGLAKDAGMLPDLVIEKLNGIGHWPMFEDPQRTADLLVKFVKEKDL